MRLSEAVELYNTKVRMTNTLSRIKEYESELHLVDSLYGFRRSKLVVLYQSIFKDVDIENIIKQKIAAIDTLLDERYEGFDL